jgi:hypothetical protein
MDITEEKSRLALEEAKIVAGRMRTTEMESRRALEDAMKAANEAKVASEKAQKAQKFTDTMYLIGIKQYQRAQKNLLDLRKNYPLDDLVCYKLSNVYKRLNDLNSAIDLTNQYIEDLRAASIEDLRAANVKSDEVIPIVLYNRACYTTLKAFSSGRDDVLLAKALDDLKGAIDLSPALGETARKDHDFEMLKNESNPRFAEIVGWEYP